VEPNYFDLMTSISGVSFDEAWEARLTESLDGIEVNSIGRDALIRNNNASGRSKDLINVYKLTWATPEIAEPNRVAWHSATILEPTSCHERRLQGSVRMAKLVVRFLPIALTMQSYAAAIAAGAWRPDSQGDYEPRRPVRLGAHGGSSRVRVQQ
jgi:hypothetical protein